jgi:hypothetical protein
MRFVGIGFRKSRLVFISVFTTRYQRKTKYFSDRSTISLVQGCEIGRFPILGAISANSVGDGSTLIAANCFCCVRRRKTGRQNPIATQGTKSFGIPNHFFGYPAKGCQKQNRGKDESLLLHTFKCASWFLLPFV